MAKKRLDVLLVEKGLAETREKAQALILAGEVTVGGTTVDKAGMAVPEQAAIAVVHGLRYVSRGGLKLEHALAALRVDPTGLVALDAGASTGGFTDCLLQHGAARVYAVDVGYGQIAWRLRTDPRVVNVERTNIRYMSTLPETVDLATADLSFISLTLAMPAIGAALKEGGRVIALVKPQFEAGKGQVGKGGVVREAAIHKQVLSRLHTWAGENGWTVCGATPSPVLGPAGNREFFLLLARGGHGRLDPQALDRVVDEGATVLPENGGAED